MYNNYNAEELREVWTKGVSIPAVSPEGNAFLDGFYETVSQNKTVSVYAAAEILLNQWRERRIPS